MLRNNLDDLDVNGKVGDWCFLNNHEHIAIRYGETAFSGTVVIPISSNHPFSCKLGDWEWNGDVTSPSVKPSILVRAVEGFSQGWHGYLTDGKLITV
jgi:hypothetical protein